MNTQHMRDIDFGPEFEFHTSRSGGPGGQNVNKVNTKVELRFHVESSALLTDEEKTLLATKLASRINSEGFLLVVCQTERSQLGNKERCVERFLELLTNATTVQKKRRASKPTYSSKLQRLQTKRCKSETKGLRRRPEV